MTVIHRHEWVFVDRCPQGLDRRMYVLGARAAGRYESPASPVVMIHGGGGQGLDFLATPDGRPGWADAFTEAGHPVYVVDRPGFGRSAAALPPTASPAVTLADATELAFGGTIDGSSQWPGSTGVDLTLRRFAAGLAPDRPLVADEQAAERDLGVALLRGIGPAVLLAHSAGAAMAWTTALSRPELVRAVVVVEPAFPVIGAPDEHLLNVVAHDWRSLANTPVVVVTTSTSPYHSQSLSVHRALADRGVASELIELEHFGIVGNGHMMMLEKNSDAIASLLLDHMT